MSPEQQAAVARLKRDVLGDHWTTHASDINVVLNALSAAEADLAVQIAKHQACATREVRLGADLAASRHLLTDLYVAVLGHVMESVHVPLGAWDAMMTTVLNAAEGRPFKQLDLPWPPAGAVPLPPAPTEASGSAPDA